MPAVRGQEQAMLLAASESIKAEAADRARRASIKAHPERRLRTRTAREQAALALRVLTLDVPAPHTLDAFVEAQRAMGLRP